MRSQGLAAGRSAAAPVPGFSRESAALLGEDDGSAAIRVRMVHTIGQLPAGHARWVKGSGVAPLLADGSIVDITGTTQQRRIWKVGGHKFLDQGQAERASVKLGLPMVEIA